MALRKTFINVIAEFTASGRLEPLSIVLYDGRCYPVDKIIDVQKAANMRVGGSGTKYSCLISGVRRSLWRDQDRWFIEESVEDVCE